MCELWLDAGPTEQTMVGCWMCRLWLAAEPTVGSVAGFWAHCADCGWMLSPLCGLRLDAKPTVVCRLWLYALAYWAVCPVCRLWLGAEPSVYCGLMLGPLCGL